MDPKSPTSVRDPSRARQRAEHAAESAVLDAAAATLARHAMLSRGTRLIAAVSGGPDSMCLLDVLHRLGPRLGFELAGVAHFNHHLRGEASLEDQRFVEQAASDRALPFHLASRDLSGEPEKGNLEQTARRARRGFFHGLIRDGLADRVALGHTRDDQAETVLFRLLRGSGISGLAGVLPATREGLIRPLLDVRRYQVEQYLTAHGIPWREDETNRSAAFSRNRIRHQLLPQLEREWNPRLTESLAQLADLAYEEERFWRGRLHKEAQLSLVSEGSGTAFGPGAVELHAPDLSGLPVAVARRLIRHALRQVLGSDLETGTPRGIDFVHVEAIRELARQSSGSGTVALPGASATRSFDWIRILPGLNSMTGAPGLEQLVPSPAAHAAAAYSIPVSGSGTYPIPGGNSLIHLEFLDGAQSSSEPRLPPTSCATLGEELDWPGYPAGLRLRSWKPGDRYRPAGYAHDQKVKDLFQQARIPSWRRAGWPILSVGGRIVWAREFGAGADSMASPGGGSRLRVWESRLEP